MFGVILTIFEFSKTIIYYSFYWSSTIGQLLVGVAKECLEIFLLLIKILTSAFFVVSESFGIFSQDVIQLLQSILELLTHFYQETTNSILWTTNKIDDSIEKLILTISSVYNFFVNGVGSILTTVGEIIVFCKHVVVVFGTSVWFAVTFIPFSIWNLIFGINTFIEELHRSTYDLTSSSAEHLKNSVIFLMDIPIEAAVGLLVAASIFYIFTQFYIIIFSYLYRQTMRTVFSLYRKFRRRTVPVQYQAIEQSNILVPRKRPCLRSDLNLSQSSKNGAEEIFCIICQERSKCILVLPCRHVCMCSECNIRLQLYDNSCPICRINIESTMKIFF